VNICHIGTIGFESRNGDKEKKTIGGIPGYILELIEELVINKNSIIFVGKIYYYKPQINLSYFEIQKEITSTNSFLVHLLFKSFLVKLNRDTIIHAHRPDHLAVFGLFRANPSILTLHGQQAVTVINRKIWIIRQIYLMLEKIAFRKAERILATDEITKCYYDKQYPFYACKIEVLPTGVNLNKFCPIDKNICRKRLKLSDEDKIILFLGRVEPPKRVDEIIESFAIINKHDKQTKLMIIGDGVKLNDMKALSIKLNLIDAVIFLGARMRGELPELINCADVSVLYSGNEGSPLSVKESLACGVPVVANRVGDVEKIIVNGKNGFIVNEESVESLAKQLEECLKKAALMKKNCIESVREYSVEKINNKLIEIYKQVGIKL
jgi:glycosyltransferase involved in cell wall biosynthesis